MDDTQFKRFETMTNNELRAELKQRGCPVSGNKKDLLAKLRVALQKEYERDNSLANTSSATEHSFTENSSPIKPSSQQLSTTPSVEEHEQVSINNTAEQETVQTNNEKPANDSQTNNNNEVNSFVSKSNEDENKNLEKLGGEEENLISIGNNDNAKSESIVKEIPLSDEQQRLNQPETINDKQDSTTNDSNDVIKNQTEIIDQPSKPADIPKQDEINIENETSQLKPNRSQILSLTKALNRSTANKINLSSELLKTLISNLSLAPESVLTDELDNESVVDNEYIPAEVMTIGDLADQKLQTTRTVAIDDPNARKKSNPLPVRLPSFEGKDGKSNIVTDEPIRIKDVSIRPEPPSQILYIRGLTRPFSLMQLKELLSRYGRLTEGEFWLDRIKSQCFVTYQTIDEAQNAREALDGCRWPLTNPKTLTVRFGQYDEFEFSKTNDLSPDHMSNNHHSEDRIVEEQTSRSPVNDKQQRNQSDQSKLEREKHSGFLITEEEENQDDDDEDQEIQEDEPVKSKEQSAKGLDDYFRKTKAKPSIYWLPLSEEQIVERARRQEQRKAERDEEQRRRDLDENARKYDKRKRSSSPSHRNSKKH